MLQILKFFVIIAAPDVIKKIKSLRTQYLREKRTVLSCKSGQGTDDNYDVKWPGHR